MKIRGGVKGQASAQPVPILICRLLDSARLSFKTRSTH
ncbi:MAG: hypothetical protein OJF50_005649 [Nitrospira sp.]|nr:hypothetical protein [Nitrospira sp.]